MRTLIWLLGVALLTSGCSAVDYAAAARNAERAGRPHDVVANAKQAVEADPSYAPGWFWLGYGSYATQQYDEAIRALEKFLSRGPTGVQVPSAHTLLGRAYDAKNEGERAFTHYKRAVELGPDDATRQNNLGVAYGVIKRDYDLAIVHLRRSVEIDAKSGNSQHSLGWAYLRRGSYEAGDFDRAVEALRRAVELGNTEASEDLKVAAARQRAGAGPRAWLGVEMRSLTSDAAKSLGMKSEKGVLVHELVPDSPAARSGLRKGDVLIEFDGRPLGTSADLLVAVLSARPGQSVTLKIWRDGAETIVTARLGTAPDAPPVAGQPTAPPPAAVSPAAPALQPSTASGSGFLLRQTNLILTNYHVVRDRKELTLRFPSGEEYRGRVVAQDRGNDLALVEAQGLTPSPRGVVVAINTAIKMGEPIHALGYPLGAGLSRQPSMVSGTVSSTLGLEDDIARFRMTAPINPGNSGGPVVNARGQVIGVAAAGLVREGVEAIRFGIKASTAALILQQAQVATAFDVVVSPTTAAPRAPDQIFNELAPAVVLIEAR